MIKSITFPESGIGYIYEKPEKPVKPNKRYREYSRMANDDFKKALLEYKKELKAWEKIKDNYKLPCSYNLIGKTFNFSRGVNIIFGANGSGKSTIIKCLASEAICGDGYSTFMEPTKLGSIFEEDYNEDALQKAITKRKLNSSIVEWDGYPVYYHNFVKTLNEAGNIFGGLTKSGIISNAGEEMIYTLYSKEISSGQNAIWLFNKLINVVSNDVSLKDIVSPYIKNDRLNSVWKRCYELQYDYFSKFENFEKSGEKTLLLDEIDVNMDIETVYKLYTIILPNLSEKYNIQFIAVSHNPMILSKQIYDNPVFNIVSLDENYTNGAKEILKQLKF